MTDHSDLASEPDDAGSSRNLASDRFQALFDQAAVGIGQLDIHGKLLNVNAALCDTLGRERHELLGKTFAEITHPDDLPGEQALLSRLLAGDIPSYRFEKRYLCKDGTPVWASRPPEGHSIRDL